MGPRIAGQPVTPRSKHHRVSERRNEIARKWLQLLKEIAPGVPRIAFVYNPTEPVNEAWLRVAEAAAPRSSNSGLDADHRSDGRCRGHRDRLGIRWTKGHLRLLIARRPWGAWRSNRRCDAKRSRIELVHCQSSRQSQSRHHLDSWDNLEHCRCCKKGSPVSNVLSFITFGSGRALHAVPHSLRGLVFNDLPSSPRLIGRVVRRLPFVTRFGCGLGLNG